MLVTSDAFAGVGPRRPKHPRPDRARALWQSLDGEWEFAFDGADEGAALGWHTGNALPQRITVPYSFEAPLSGLGLGDEVHEWVWYRRRVTVSEQLRAKSVLLHFGAVDWEATVWVNGRLAGQHRGGYAPFTLNVTNLLLPFGGQEVVVRAYDPASPHNGGTQPRGKQRGSWRIWYARTTGIWGPVWLEGVGAAWLDRPRLLADSATGTVRVEPGVAGAAEALQVSVEVLDEGVTVARARGSDAVDVVVPDRRLWSPESPTLYDVVLRLHGGDALLDEVTSYVAFRSIEVRDGQIHLNGRPRFVRGVLDQGYWPDGGCTAPSQQALRADVEAVRALGLDLVRKHAKVEDPHWYHWCDRVGLLVAQDMPSSQDLSSAEARDGFRTEWLEVLEHLAAHPSIVMWILFNEDWGAPGRTFQQEVVALTRATDPTRLVIDASGWITWGDGDLIDVHDYTDRPGELIDRPSSGVARWVGEYGGVSLPVTVEGAHAERSWGYSAVTDSAHLLGRVRALVEQVDDPQRVAGWVYTQLTDVEAETNGLLTADRRWKAPREELAAVLTGPGPGQALNEDTA